MFVKNTTKGVIGVALKAGGRLNLLPGNNEVQTKQWKEALEIEEIGTMMDDGRLEVVGGAEAAKTPEKAPQSLSDMNATDAIALVGETMDMATLERWRGQEQRVTVKNAIEKQIEKVEISEEEAEGDADE